LHKPVELLPQDRLVSQQDLDDFFVGQVHEIRKRYGMDANE
jgi:hypothetical protein